jgi:hypothetical protein
MFPFMIVLLKMPSQAQTSLFNATIVPRGHRIGVKTDYPIYFITLPTTPNRLRTAKNGPVCATDPNERAGIADRTTAERLADSSKKLWTGVDGMD